MTTNTDNTAAIEEDISNIAIELYNINSLFHDSDAVHDFIENYINHVTRIGFRVGKADYIALRDSCVIFREILDTLNKNNTQITENHFQLFEVWPTLILAYITHPDDANSVELLLNFLQDPLWAYQKNENEFIELRNAFNHSLSGTVLRSDTLSIKKSEYNDVPTLENQGDSLRESEEENSEAEESLVNAFDGALFESIQQEILETMTGLISDLASTDADDDFGLNHAFNLCADRIELLGMSIATAGLVGLMDVCMIFQTGLRDLAKREQPLSNDEQIIIEEWTSHLIAYLNYPVDHGIIDNLVNYLSEIPWSENMSTEEMMTLRLMLIPEDIEVTAPVESDDFTESEVQATNVQVRGNDVSVVEQEQELVYEMDDPEGIDNVSVPEDMYFLGQELIRLIQDEFELEQPSLNEAIFKIQADVELNENNIEQLSLFKLMIERFSLATESIGLTGINKILINLIDNLNIFTDSSSKYTLNSDIVNSLKNFSELALNYLRNMDDSEVIKSLLTPFYLDKWPVKINIVQDALQKELLSPRLMIEDDIEIRATQATTDDISLKLPNDVNQDLLNTLLQELPVQTEEFTQSITQLVEGNATLQDVEKAQRIAHTLKGAANTVGIVGIATLTHHIEDIFNVFTEKKRLPGKKLADTLMNAADVLEMMSESLLGLGDEPEQAQNVLQRVLDWANLLDQEGIPEDDAQIQLNQNESDSDKAKQQDASHLSDVVVPTMLRVPAPLMDELLRIAGESIILSGQLQERLRKAIEQTHLIHEQNTLYQQLVIELEQVVDVQGLSTNKPNLKSNDVFDSLELEQYNELHTITHRLVEAATDSKELTHNIEDELNTLETLLVDQSRLHKDNQNIVMQTRMVPVQTIVPRLQRSIRQTARSTSKKVTLNVKGTETLMDSDVLNELIDPLMHILRNAVDHGIESEAVRTQKGKETTGNIELTFLQDGDHIVVRCIDDGAGLDFKAIKNTAIKKQFIKADEDVTNEELSRLIWLAGFTTRETTTQVSGRGIGMDAVYNQITAMKGTINIQSESNIGCTVELRLPLTLISVHAILVQLRKQTIAISNRGIEQIHTSGDGELVRDNETYSYHLNEEVITAFDIETLLHQSREQLEDNDGRTVFIVRNETGKQYAVTVQQVIANQDLIVKQLGTYIPNIVGIEGATILGDGSVAPVLELPGLIKTTINKDISPLIEQRLVEVESIDEGLTALIVDDSLSARRSLAEFVKDIGYNVSMAKDGIEALEIIDGNKPDIILVDLEMPRMNGLEMTSHLRSKPETRDIPIIMVTSRTTEKHRDMADGAGVSAYLTKPFSEDELLENIQSLLLSTTE